MTPTAVAADSREFDHHDQHRDHGIATDGDMDPSVERQKSVKNRQFNIYAARAHSPSPGAHHDPKPNPPTSDKYESEHPSPDEAPQLPPLPISPRWDSLANNNTSFFLQKSNTALAVSPPDPPPSDSLAERLESGRHTPTNDFSHQPLVSPISEPEPRISTDTVQSQNFSRPRKLSLKQPTLDSAKPRQTLFPSPFAPPPDLLPDLASPRDGRSRGQSNASTKTSSTFSSVPLPPGSDIYDPGRSRLRHATTAPAAVRPAPSFTQNRIDSAGSGYTRDMAPWISADESRSSYRSQLTASSAQGTWMTERSSILTRDSSVPSVYAGPDEPSLEDVMGMYEKGFHDDSSPEDFDDLHFHDKINDGAMNRRNTRILEALEKSLPAPPTSGLGMGPLVRESTEMFRGEEPPLALPKSSTFGDFNKRHENEKRDSAKSLHESPPSRQGPPPIEHEDPESRDRYGFRKANQYVTREQYDTWNTGYVEYLARRRKKWVAYHKEMGLLTDKPDRFPPPASTKTKRFVRKGIPPDWRGAAWFYYAGGPAILAEYSGVYDELLTKQVSAVDAEAIERDLHRTFPDNIKFKPNNLSTNTDSSRSSNQTTSETASSGGEDGEPRMISSLRRVLRAFAIQNPLIGYCQSLNFLAGLLLLFLETEEQAFWLLNVITRVYLPGTHAMSLEGSKVDLGVLMGAIRESMPTVWAKIGDELDGDPNESRPTTSGGSAAKKARSRRKHMANKSVSTDRLPPITLCMTAWFMSCFIGTLPIETTLRVWDVFFLESSKTLFRVALTIFKLGEAEIKAVADPMEMFSVVQAMPRRLIDANALMESCYKRRNAFGHLNQDTIDALRQERRDKTQLDRDKLAGHVTDGEAKVRRKNTLFGRRPKRDASA
ncbi:hypothetical protein VDGE_07794 [Verticillium dahliae]|uniref:Rab-GAP TBC domain-containing protein n=1 Tax=Verticillium dahliae TaxID=27337 RepID=A0A444RMG5_VERDA|nr:hypothetical protein VDGE_07794 [Verticillium dahliae]